MSVENQSASNIQEKIGPCLEDKVLYNPDGSPVVMNKTARKAFLILKKENPQLEGVVVKNPDIDYENMHPFERSWCNFSRFRNAAIIVPARQESTYNNDLRISKKREIEIWAEKSGMLCRQMTNDMLAVFEIAHEAKHCLDHKEKGHRKFKREGFWEDNKFSRTIEYYEVLFSDDPVMKEDMKIEEYRSRPQEVRADDFAGDFMKNHMYLFDPSINHELGQWQKGPSAW